MSAKNPFALEDPRHETFAPCRPDHDGYCRRRRGVDGVRAAKRMRSRADLGAPARAGRTLSGILPRELRRLRRRAASAARAFPWWPRAWWSRPWRRLALRHAAPHLRRTRRLA